MGILSTYDQTQDLKRVDGEAVAFRLEMRRRMFSLLTDMAENGIPSAETDELRKSFDAFAHDVFGDVQGSIARRAEALRLELQDDRRVA